ncbi:type II toxin-antitoxin system YafQ family toxin [Helicobacter burdigaliensis]|uniref:type II toxin-antitoxin system YafQ family toxin n=1 Tax=Helicobacter burdigaliensis TaxID=2315334 RepID=UPI001300625E
MKSTFPKNLKKGIKKLSQNDIEQTFKIIEKLINNETLEAKYKDHKLKGKFKDFRECHIKPNLLLVYQKQEDILILTCINIGTHSDLFKS